MLDLPYVSRKVCEPFLPKPQGPAIGEKPGMPVATRPPKLTLPNAFFPTLSPSMIVEFEPTVANDSVLTVLNCCPPPSAFDIALMTGLSSSSEFVKSLLLMTSSPVSSGLTYWFRVVMGANGLPCLLSGMGAGCMFSPCFSSGRAQKSRHLPPCPIRKSGW